VSNKGDSSAGFWVIVAILGAIVLYFWREVITFILEFILGILKLVQNILTELFFVGLFLGALYLISKLFESKK
jgi:hypothetical protein